MLDKPIITLTTDFGLKDSFVGMMKGVILGINPQASIIDITHNIERHNIYEASQVIAMSYKYFPPTSIHITVVDPGVGGNRRPILVVTENYYFIGPDNGIFTTIFEKENNNFFKVINITASHYFLTVAGKTLHGRDIFAPAAAWLSKGVESNKFGEHISDYVKISSPEPSLSNDNIISGEVVSFDHFGNAITNVSTDILTQLGPIDSKQKFKITFKDEVVPFVDYYAEVKDQSLSAIINGFNHLELFVNQKDAAQLFNIKPGDPVTVTVEK